MSTADRRGALRARLAAAGVDVLLVTKLPNVRYLSGFTGSAGRVLVHTATDDAVLVTDGRYAEQAAAQAPDTPALVNPAAGWLRARLEAGWVLGVESDELSWDAARSLVEALDDVAVAPAPGHVEALRAVKDATEVAAIARACALADAALADVVATLRPGRSEREVALQLERAMVDRGAQAPAFDSIVAFGEHTAQPHHQPTERVLAVGDTIKLDFGARVDGYCSDMTRMLSMGPPAPRLRALHDVVARAQQAGVDAVHAGVTAGRVDAACREVIAAEGLGELFVHGTGHGVGLQIHEDPLLAKGRTATLLSRMAVTVEPGVYVPGLGGVRIEDTVVVMTGDADVLTASSKDLVVV